MSFSIRLKGQFLLLAGIVVAVVLSVGSLAALRVHQSTAVTEEVGERLLPAVEKLGDLRATMTRVRLGATRVLDGTDAAAVDQARARNLARINEMEGLIRDFAVRAAGTEADAGFSAFTAGWKAYLEAQAAAFDLAGKDEHAAARAAFNGPANQSYDTAWKVLEQLKVDASRTAYRGTEAVRAAHGITLAAIAAATGIGGLLTLALMGWLARDVAGRAVKVAAAMTKLAGGDAETPVPCTERRDEIAEIARAALDFRASLLRNRQLESEAALERAGAEAQRKEAMRQMADTFERSVGGIIATVTAAATELQATAQSMTATATQTASQSTTVATAAEEAASNVDTVAAAAEELGSSVREIGRQVGGSSTLAQGAVAEAAQTAAVVQDLSEAAARIGDVVAMISSIAGQTNLLALNATIEAARAGEAGRGFAVVATEVKELAAQTARATGEIGSQIGRIQDSTRQAVAAIDAIADRIREVSGVSTAIATAVEEQAAATQEVVRNVGEAASRTSAVTANVGGLAAAADKTGAAASQVLTSATELSRQSEHLNAEMGRMLASLRAA